VRFAAKEAIAKALGVGMRIMSRHGIAWHEAEVINDAKGKPIVMLHGHAEQLARELNIAYWSLSLSHDHEYAIAMAVALGK
jgi:holo-[acyl-carrier protein] synthase